VLDARCQSRGGRAGAAAGALREGSNRTSKNAIILLVLFIFKSLSLKFVAAVHSEKGTISV
jgi:hypothetical protein